MKKYLDFDRYGDILNTLIKNGITVPIINLARKMDFNLVKLFNDRIVNCNNNDKDENINVVSKNLLGVFGNYLTYNYYSSLGYNVSLEYPIYDKDGNLLTKADIAYFDNNNIFNLCEVKTAFQIIENEDAYIENNDSSEYNKKKEIIKYQEIGKKLYKQAKKLKENSRNVNIVIFDNCNIDSSLKEKFKSMGVKLNVISINVYKLFEFTKNLVSKIYDEYHKNGNYISKHLAN